MSSRRVVLPPTRQGKKILNLTASAIIVTGHAVDRLREHDPLSSKNKIVDLILEAAKQERNWVDRNLITAATGRRPGPERDKFSHYIAHPTDPRGVFVLLYNPEALGRIDCVSVITYLRFLPSQIAIVFPWHNDKKEEKNWAEVASIFDDSEFASCVRKKLLSDPQSMSKSHLKIMQRLLDFMQATIHSDPDE